MIYLIISFTIGGLAVLQAGLNRQIANEAGLSAAVLINSGILLAVASLFWMVCAAYPQFFPENFASKFNLAQVRWWYFVPAVCGFALITGIPGLIPKLGATGVFLCVVVGQLTFSFLWDLSVEQIPFDIKRLAGIVIALIGMSLANWPR
jgi:uncharacterized membrane protein YdcZ (DUF606 family)